MKYLSGEKFQVYFAEFFRGRSERGSIYKLNSHLRPSAENAKQNKELSSGFTRSPDHLHGLLSNLTNCEISVRGKVLGVDILLSL